MQEKIENNDVLAIFQQYRRIMLSTAYKILGNCVDSEDVVQDIFEKILRSPNSVLNIPSEELKPYLIVVTKHASYSAFKKNNKYISVPFEEIDTYLLDDGSPETIMMTELDNIDIFNLPRMKDKYKEVIILLFYYEHTVAQVAKELNTTEGNIRIRLHRALEQLRNQDDLAKAIK